MTNNQPIPSEVFSLTCVAYSLACKELAKLSGKPASCWSKKLIQKADRELSSEDGVAEFEQMLADALNFGKKL